ncbi:MAG: SHOCT domain-containing protein [Clostridiaceae bacterium]
MMYGRGYNGINGVFDGFGFMHHGIGMFLMLILLIAVTVVIVFMLKKHKNNNINESALEELKLRFVKEEISEEEYLKRKKLIGM